MKKKWKIIWSAFIAAILFMMGMVIVFPEKFFPDISSTYAEVIKTNWGIVIPDPDQETTVKNEREFHGDGETITELKYEKPGDIQSIKNLSPSWMNGEEFEKAKKEFPPWISDLIKDADKDAEYFCLQKNEDDDYIIFELKGSNVTIYESYM